jgi:hypothetical protein
MTLAMSAQTFQRRATIVNGGSRDQGHCTVEVTVDDSADIEIRGSDATLRNTKGQPPQWRRFECTAPMPANAPNLTFSGVAGRGRQGLVRDPRNNGGTAVVQIQDSEDGADIYAFDLYWGAPRGPATSFRDPRDDRRDDSRDRSFEGPGQPSFERRGDRFTKEQAVQVCQDSIRQQAIDRFGTPNIDFRRIAMDDNPGRQDYVNGELAVRRRFGRQNLYRFTCSVNFDTGRVRTARIDQFETQYYPR